jgi:hypothetical protein
MSRLALLALAALIPVALNPALAATGRSLLTPVWTGDGRVHLVRTPLDAPKLPGSDPAGCCVKGCHAPGARKRVVSKS